MGGLTPGRFYVYGKANRTLFTIDVAVSGIRGMRPLRRLTAYGYVGDFDMLTMRETSALWRRVGLMNPGKANVSISWPLRHDHIKGGCLKWGKKKRP